MMMHYVVDKIQIVTVMMQCAADSMNLELTQYIVQLMMQCVSVLMHCFIKIIRLQMIKHYLA